MTLGLVRHKGKIWIWDKEAKKILYGPWDNDAKGIKSATVILNEKRNG